MKLIFVSSAKVETVVVVVVVVAQFSWISGRVFFFFCGWAIRISLMRVVVKTCYQGVFVVVVFKSTCCFYYLEVMLCLLIVIVYVDR